MAQHRALAVAQNYSAVVYCLLSASLCATKCLKKCKIPVINFLLAIVVLLA